MRTNPAKQPTAPAPEAFASLAFPPERKSLYVREVALKLCVTSKHVGDLVEEGELRAVEIGGTGSDWLRVPGSFFAELARRSGIAEKELLKLLDAARAKAAPARRTRKFWRVTHESYRAFIRARQNASKRQCAPPQ